MRVNVYRNLSPQYKGQRAWSLMAQEGPSKGKVIDIVDAVILKDVTFVVREGGRQRVLRDKQKNVHAFVQGDLVKTFPLNTLKKTATGTALAPGKDASVRVSYDPYHAGYFFREDTGKAVADAPLVVVAPAGVYAAKPSVLRGFAGLGALLGEWPTEVDPDRWNG
jgi:hypothetical protein